MLSSETKSLGVITASAGNRALALSYHGKSLGIQVTCVMPTVAPLATVNLCREIGANVILHGTHIGEAKVFAMREYPQLRYINGYDDPENIDVAGSLDTCAKLSIRS